MPGLMCLYWFKCCVGHLSLSQENQMMVDEVQMKAKCIPLHFLRLMVVRV